MTRAALAAFCLAGPLAAVTAGVTAAAPAAAAATAGAYGGTANGGLVAASAVTIPGTLQVANTVVGPSTAQVSSSSQIQAAPGKQSYARAANIDTQLINGSIPLNNLIVEADQSAAPDNPNGVTKTLLSVPANPLANLTVATAAANARWLGADCVPLGTDIAHGTSTVATADVLTGTPLGSSLVSLQNSAGGPVTSDSSVQLVQVAGQTGEGVQSRQASQLTGVVLFKGTSNQLTINVLAPPEITAVATGTPGKSTVTYTEPILQVYRGTTLLGELNAATNQRTLTIPALATLSLGAFTSTITPDGTTASGSAALLDVQVGISPLPINLATIAIAPASVSSTVPAGGVQCSNTNPLDESHKDVSASVVSPGNTFTYTVTVPNRGQCTLVNVKVVDTITAPAGTTVVSTAPPASSVSGLVLTWNDIGPIAPNETKNLQITVQAPANLRNGQAFSNHADITGICQNAPPGTPPFTKGVDVNGPTGFVPVAMNCHLDGSNKAADHLQVTPGETFNYYIHVLNDGTQACTNVTVTDTLGPNVTFVSATDGGTLTGTTVTWHLGTLAPGASRTVAVEVSVNPSVAPGTTLPDTALITADQEQHQVSTPGPVVSTISVLAPPNPAQPTGVLNTGQSASTLPVTGGQPLAPYGLGLLVVGFAARGWRRRRTI